MNTMTFPSRRAERGAALITGLIFMVVLTMIAMAALRGTVLEEKMAGNARDIDLAFQSAEAALRGGEQVLNQATLPTFAATGPYLTASGSRGDSTYWINYTWNDANSSALSTAPAGVAEAPRFVIEQMPSVAGAGGSLKAGPIAESGMYRVTARGVGGSPNTRIYLQETYRR
jgi:type IV pilus assembly protein PilX